jgi:multisubunit Na+/H+ antiporter MnhB subunit
MKTSIIIIGLLMILFGLFAPIILFPLLLLIGIVAIIVGLCMESEKEKIMRKRRLCRICGKPITKEQAETLGICQKCFDAENKEK